MNKKGFTTIELLIVIIVIGILGWITLGQFETAKARARDVGRKSDLNEISKAIRLYYADYGHLPDKNIKGDPDINSIGGKPFVDSRGYEYMKAVPYEKVYQDKPYCYEPDEKNKTFKLFTELEVKSDPDCKTGKYSCGGRSYCYTDTIYAIVSKS